MQSRMEGGTIEARKLGPAGSVATRGQVLGVTLGNALEFYDFLVFSFYAVQIGKCFFPSGNPTTSLLSALATFGAGFLTRPLGAFILGGLGDRLGRRPVLLVTFLLIGMSSLGIALTPPYAAVGIVAPIIVILCRLVQGFALGGEQGASTAFLAESAPLNRRGLYISLQHVSSFMATLVAGIIGVGLASLLDAAALDAWGWRIAMAFGVLIVPVGMVLRRSLPETLHDDVAAQTLPRFTSYWLTATLALLMLLSGTIGTYVLIFMTTYAQTTLKLSPGVAFGATIAVGLAGMIASLTAGLVSDRIGRKPVMLWAAAISAVSILPVYWLIKNAVSGAAFLLLVFLLRLTTQIAASTALINVTEAFPPRIRSGGVAVTYALATSVFGGTTQFVIAWLIGATHNPLAPGWYMLGATIVGMIGMYFARETAPVKLKRLDDRDMPL